MMSDFEVAMGESNSPSDFYVKFVAPKDSQKHTPHTSRGERRAPPPTTAAPDRMLVLAHRRGESARETAAVLDGRAVTHSNLCVRCFVLSAGLYDGGIYRIHVTLPATYPYKSPSIGFQTKIFHPNVDEASGSVCLDVINQTWSPMYDLVNIFSVFLPQLLLYPNPADPLNGQAAALMFKEPEAYKMRIKEHVKKHASVDFKLSNDDDEDDDEPAATPAKAAAAKAESEDDAAAAAADDDGQVMSDMDEEILSDLDEEAAEEEGIKAEA